MSSLRKAASAWVAWIKIRGCIVRGKQHQATQEIQQIALVVARQAGIVVAGELSLAAMTKNHLMQRVAAAIMPIGRRAGYTPEWRSEEELLHGAIVVPFVKVGAKVMALEIRKDVGDQKRLHRR